MFAGWLMRMKWQIPCGEGLYSRVYTVQRCSLSLPVFRILVLRMLEGDDYTYIYNLPNYSTPSI